MSKVRNLNPYDMEERIHNLEKNGGVSSDEAKRSDIATEFSIETSYTAGNFVYYQGKLYIFNVDHAAGAWDAADVSPANVTDEVTSNKVAIDELASDKSTVMFKDVTVTLEPGSTGGYVGTPTGIAGNKILSVCPVYNDDLFYVLKSDGMAGFLYAFKTDGTLTITTPGSKNWGEVTAQRTLTFRVAYLA